METLLRGNCLRLSSCGYISRHKLRCFTVNIEAINDWQSLAMTLVFNLYDSCNSLAVKTEIMTLERAQPGWDKLPSFMLPIITKPSREYW